MDKMERISPGRSDRVLSHWAQPPVTPPLRTIIEKHQSAELDLKHLGKWVGAELSQNRDIETKVQVEQACLDWLCDLTRANVKRGRVFELDQVLQEGAADCLGYAKTLVLLGGRFALDIGIVEVVIDNAGRYVPHVANILNLANGRRRFVDLWYGSRNANHRRWGLQVREGTTCLIKDVSQDDMDRLTGVEGLPMKAVDAITCYIMANRHLEHGLRYGEEEELAQAMKYYDLAIRLYPQNARFYFNRAVAYENMGEPQKAEAGYARALQDEASQIRVLAREYPETTQLIELDERGISPRDQEVYLLRKGFVTGEEVDRGAVAVRCKVSSEEVERIVSEIEARLRQADG